MNRRRRRINPLRILVLGALVLVALYVNQVVVPATPPLFMPTPTPTTAPATIINDAQTLEAEGKFVQAVEAYKAAIDADPQNGGNYISLARLQIYTRDYDGAIDSAENALLINPNNAIAFALRGYALGLKGDYLTAITALDSAIEQDPNNAIPYAYKAEVMARQFQVGQGDLDSQEQARQWSQKAQDLGPDLLETHRARGMILEMFGTTENLEIAAQEYEAAVSQNPNIADLHVALGRIYRTLEVWAKAEDEYLKAITLNPTDPEPYVGLSKTHYRAGNLDRALQYAEQALQHEPDNPYWHGNMGFMLYKKKQYAEAVKYLARSVLGGTYDAGEIGQVTVEPYPIEEELGLGYYMYYGLALSYAGECGEALEVSQFIALSFSEDETHAINAEEMVNICQRLLETGTTEEPTPTPPVVEEPAVEQPAG